MTKNKNQCPLTFRNFAECKGAAGRKNPKSKRDLHERQFIIYKNERKYLKNNKNRNILKN